MQTMCAVMFSMVFLNLFPLFSHAAPLEDAADMIEYKTKEIACREKADGLFAEICIKEAFLEYQQKKNAPTALPRNHETGQEMTDREMRDRLTDPRLLDVLYLTGRELIELKKRYYQERWQMEQDYKKQSVNFDEDIANCRFQEVEAALKNTVSLFARRYPDSIVVRDAQDEKGYVWGKINTRKAELARAEQAASTALADGAKSRDFCVAWNAPSALLSADVLAKCRPNLLAQMRRVSEQSNDAERGFKQFKVQRDESIKYAQRCVAECRDLQGSWERLRALNPGPYAKCAEYMLRQEVGPDAVDYAKRDIESRAKDLQSRQQRVSHILAGTNEALLRCDWRAVDRMKSDALNSLPEENCIGNYPAFAKLRESAKDLDRKKQVRSNEVRILGDKMFQRLKYAEGYLKAIGLRDSRTWDAAAIGKYNEERKGLDYLVREAHTQSYTHCLQELIAQINALPPALQVPEAPARRARTRFDGPTWQGRRLDRCVSYATNCDEPAATEFCRRNQFQRAVEWKWDHHSHTRTLSGQNCDPPTRCGGFTYVVCE